MIDNTRFTDEFVSWTHLTPVGVKVSEIFGMDSKSGKIWMEMARQIYCEQGDFFRVIDHYPDGAPFLEGIPMRISITHTTHFFAVASLPKTPEQNLEEFNLRTAMGIDAESLSREQVLKVKSRFLSESEMKVIGEEDREKCIIAWTAKEALYKAAFHHGLDFKKDIRIIQLPTIDRSTSGSMATTGRGTVCFPDETGRGEVDFILYSYESYGCCVTIALSPKCAKFGKK